MADRFAIVVLARARLDVEAIYSWLHERSPGGANRWYAAFHESANSLAIASDRHGLAPESAFVSQPVRQCVFKTPAGRNYRLLYLVVGAQVRILRVRGPGQPPVQLSDDEYNG